MNRVVVRIALAVVVAATVLICSRSFPSHISPEDIAQPQSGVLWQR